MLLYILKIFVSHMEQAFRHSCCKKLQMKICSSEGFKREVFYCIGRVFLCRFSTLKWCPKVYRSFGDIKYELLVLSYICIIRVRTYVYTYTYVLLIARCCCNFTTLNYTLPADEPCVNCGDTRRRVQV